MATIQEMKFVLDENYVEVTTILEDPSDPKGIENYSHWSLRDSYYERLYLNKALPLELTAFEIINSFNGNRIYVNWLLFGDDKILINGTPANPSGFENFLRKYTAKYEN